MSDSVKRDAFTLRRWSQRKLAASRGDETPPQSSNDGAAPAPAAVGSQTVGSQAVASQAVASQAVASQAVASQAVASQAAPLADSGTPASAGLPPLESLTNESDFSVFMQPDVDETVKRGALRKLFSDPHFNVMDGLDVYIDDYSKPDPIAPDIVRTLAQARYIFDPPQSHVNARGEVDDGPPPDVARKLPDVGDAAPSLAAADATTPAPLDGTAVVDADRDAGQVDAGDGFAAEHDNKPPQ